MTSIIHKKRDLETKNDKLNLRSINSPPTELIKQSHHFSDWIQREIFSKHIWFKLTNNIEHNFLLLFYILDGKFEIVIVVLCPSSKNCPEINKMTVIKLNLIWEPCEIVEILCK